ncbi:MAG: hypothetical protein ACLGJD_20000 [Gammaproteobacteria bacterium]
MQLMASPKRTIELLDELQLEGFNDQAFGLLHHFRVTRQQMDTIEKHRKYCLQRERLHAGGTNEKVQKRLQLVLNAYRAGPFRGGAAVFELLAEAAVREIPLDQSEGE